MMVRTRRGRAKLGKWGAAELAHDPAAPNGINVGETVTINYDNDSVTIDIPDLDAAWAKLRLVWKGRDIDGARLRTRHIFTPVEGIQLLGTVDAVIGAAVGFGAKYEIQVVDSAGRIGYSAGLRAPVEVGLDQTPPQIGDQVIVGSGVVGTSHSLSYSMIGNPTPTVTYQWKADGSNIGGATAATYTPVSGDNGKALTCQITATNGVGSPAVETTPAITVVLQVAPVVATATISGSGTVNTLHAAGYTLSNPGIPAAAITYSWEMDGVAVGATDSTYTPITTGTLTVVVTATNSVGSHFLESAGMAISSTPANVAPDITAGSITTNTPATDLVGGTYGLSLTYIGTPAPTLTYQWKLNAVAVSGATNATYTAPPNSTATLTCTITATNSVGSDSFTTAGVVLVPVQPAPVADANWEFTTSTPSSGVTRLETIRISAALGPTVMQWTTTGFPSDAEAEAAGHYEDTTLLSTAGGWTTFDVPNVEDPNNPSRFSNDFNPTVYPGDAVRAGRLAIRIKTNSGVYSIRSAVKQVPLTSGRFVLGDWLPLHQRTQAQYIGAGTLAAPQPGPAGGGFQYQRSFANSPADPDFIFAGEDIGIPQMTLDFGGWWEHPPIVGLKCGQSVQSVAIDSQDANRILALYAASFLRGTASSPNGWDNHTGIYLSTDKGRNFTLVKNITALGGSASNEAGETNVRFQQHCFAEVPGGTASTREWWLIAHRMPKGQTTLDNAVLKSLDGGTTWTQLTTLSAATYGQVCGLVRHPTSGHWWLYGETGLFKSTTTPAGTWTNITSTTNLPAGRVTMIDVGGASGEVWASVRGNGLWKTTNGGTGASSWTQVFAYDIETFVISPHNRNLILCAGDNGVKPRRSSDGGATWPTTRTNPSPPPTNIDIVVTNPLPGQNAAFHSYIQDTHAQFIWHKTDPNKVFVQRFQHHGVSEDAGLTFNWASANFDYNFIQDMAPDPNDWRDVLFNSTDRYCFLGIDGHHYMYDDDIKPPDEAAIAAAGGITGHVGAGRAALILRNGSAVAYIGALGNTTNRSPFRLNASGSNPIGGSVTVLTYYGAQWANFGIIDPTDSSRGYLGRNRFTLAGAGTLSQADMGKECIGIDASGNVYAVNKGNPSGTTETVYKTTNPTGSPPTWSAWVTLPRWPRPTDSDPRGFAWDHTVSNGRLLTACRNGEFYLAENGAVRQVATVVGLSPGSWPDSSSYSCALDPTSNAAYVTLNRFGGKNVFKTNDITADPPTWFDITGDFFPACPNRLYTHRVTGDIINSNHSGSFVYQSHPRKSLMKSDVRAATTANITLSGAQTIDGVAVVAGDRVLVKNQSTASQNGIYVAASGAWARATDFDATADITKGTCVKVTSGTANGGKYYSISTAVPAIGSSIAFAENFSYYSEVYSVLTQYQF